MRPSSIFVGGLGDDITRDDLEREFAKYGKMNSIWVAQNPPGFAFIEFDDDEDASEAIKEMNGTTINGSRIRVDVSRNNGRGGRGSRRGSGFRGGSGGGGFRGGRGNYSSGGPRYNSGDRSDQYDRPSYGGSGDYKRNSGYRSRSPGGQRSDNNW